MAHDLSHLGFLAGEISRRITISTTPFMAGDYFEMDAVVALRLSPLRRGLAIASTVVIITLCAPNRVVYDDEWIQFRKDDVRAVLQQTVNISVYMDHVFFFKQKTAYEMRT